MTRKIPAALAAVGAVFVIAACGGYDPTEAVNSLNKQLNDQLQSSLQAAGVSSSVASQAGLTVKCPDSVEKGQSFDCSVTGKASGESVDVPRKSSTPPSRASPRPKRASRSASSRTDYPNV